MNTHVLFAVFRRNFVSYFANPTGYLFICLFVLLGAIRAFWVPDFFGNNLANLDQLSLVFPFIMLVYIPTITMGIWAEERKQGTDELLLTIPAADFDIVLGKYLAALAIFTVALLFSLVCNYLVLNNLASTGVAIALEPRLDLGLFLGTYVGYWLVGMAMLGIGLVASFLTGNITIGFVLGMVFNAPLVFLSRADAVVGTASQEKVQAVESWSLGHQMHDFSRGVLSLSGIVYFLMILVVALYASMVLIGRRHWKIGTLMPSRGATLCIIVLSALAAAADLVVSLILYLKEESEPFRGVATTLCFVWIGVAIVLFLVVVAVPWPWKSQRSSFYTLLHYALRTLALAVMVVGMVVLFRHHDLRRDVTSERLGSLSAETRTLIADLETKRPVRIEAFISPSVPEDYVQTRLNLLTILEELQSIGGGKLDVRIHETPLHSKEAALAEKRYGIEPRQIMSISHGVYSVKPVFMNVVVTCGSDKRVPPQFIDCDTPAEYELVRSICTVTQQKRKRLGVLSTDAQLYGGINMQTMSPSPNWPIVDELEKQYEVVRVDPAKPITEKYDVLLAVQPSAMGVEEMNNFIAAVAAGQPTAIFEDPAPLLSNVAATSMPRQAGGNPMMRMQQQPKGNIRRLWTLLGVEFPDSKIAWQDFNPYPKISDFTKNREFVFVDTGSDAKQPFNPNESISSGLQQVLFPFPGFVRKRETSDLKFTPLVRTGIETGTVNYRDMMEMSPFGGPRGLNPSRPKTSTGEQYVLSARIQGKVEYQPPMEEPFRDLSGKKDEKKPAEKKPIHGTVDVVLSTDIDMLSQAFFVLRERGERPEIGVHFRFDNVTFVLNILDVLAGDNRFVEVRKRRPTHRILARVEEQTKEAKKKAADERENYVKEYEEQEQQEQKDIEDKIAELRKRKDMDIQQMAIEVGMMQRTLEQQREAKLEQLRRKKERQFNTIETELAAKVNDVQFWYKLWAVLLPPIPPLIVALIVLITRRIKEREGVAKSRLRG
jgi:ABC-2 type transport system permease protein